MTRTGGLVEPPAHNSTCGHWPARIAGHSRGAGMEQSSRSQMAAAWLLAFPLFTFFNLFNYFSSKNMDIVYK